MQRCERVLDRLGMKVSLKGYVYWAEAMNYMLNAESHKPLIRMMDLYSYIGEKYCDSADRVERALRNAISVTPQVTETIKSTFGVKYKLNNSRTLIYLVRMVREDEANESSKV